MTKRFIIVPAAMVGLLFLLIPPDAQAQVNAGEDLTVSAGLPVILSGTYEGYFGIPVTAQDDYFVGPFDIGFTFTYFGEDFTQFAIGPNGLVSFHVPGIIGFSYWTPCSIPNDIFPVTIMGPYQDLFSRPTAPHSRYIYYNTIGGAPNRRLVVGWCEAPMFNCETQLATFQIVLNEIDHSIMNHLILKPECLLNFENKATQGLNRDGNNGVVVPGRNWQPWVSVNESWQYVPAGPDTYTLDSVEYNPEVITTQGNVSWSWYKGSRADGEYIGNEQSVIIVPRENGIYTVEITLCDGQKYTDEVAITVIPVPNAFNPNSPVEQNRRFKFFASRPENVADFTMLIYDRWGKLLFETHSVEEGWDGSSGGIDCQMGVYIWTIIYSDGKDEVSGKGTVTLVR
jgi:gliding motility-associated-like protein